MEFENAQVRVFRVKLGPKEAIPLHEHALNRVVTYLTGQKVKVTTVHGKSELSEHKAGDVSWGGPAKHTEENLNNAPVEVLVGGTEGMRRFRNLPPAGRNSPCNSQNKGSHR